MKWSYTPVPGAIPSIDMWMEALELCCAWWAVMHDDSDVNNNKKDFMDFKQ